MRENLKAMRAEKEAAAAELRAAEDRMTLLDKERAALHDTLLTREQELGLQPVATVAEGKKNRAAVLLEITRLKEEAAGLAAEKSDWVEKREALEAAVVAGKEELSRMQEAADARVEAAEGQARALAEQVA